MVLEGATSYFRDLSDLLRTMQVTDAGGRPLSLDEEAANAVDIIRAAKAAGGKVMLIGNGGSAAIVSHMHNDLSKAAGVRAVVFHELPLLTALTNDHGYEGVFARPLELWADPGDVLFAVSSGGRSANILAAVRAAVARECRVITLTGFDADNPLRRMGHLNFYVSSQSYGYVETAHSALAHYLTDRASLSTSNGPR
jgi:D-sedoheptulose 7-phosphate isomerase